MTTEIQTNETFETASVPADRRTIVHIADLHLRDEPDAQSALRAVEDVFLHVARTQPDAALIALTGDIAHHGGRRAYERLADALAAAPEQIGRIPLRLIPGNHDDTGLLARIFPDQAPRRGGGQGPASTALGWCIVEDFPDLTLIRLDTCLPGQPDGALSPARLSWLAEALDRARMPVLILQHHPPFPSGQANLDAFGLADSKRLAEVLRPWRHKIVAMLCGHHHRDAGGLWRGIPVFCNSGLAHGWTLATGPDDPLREVVQDPAHAVVEIGKDTVLSRRIPISGRVE